MNLVKRSNIYAWLQFFLLLLRRRVRANAAQLSSNYIIYKYKYIYDVKHIRIIAK